MLTTYVYRKGKEIETSVSRADMVKALRDKETMLWVDIEDPTEFESETLVEIFNFHPLAVEDCVTDISQPKVDDYEEYLFLVMHAVTVVESKLETIEVDIFLGENYVVTFHRSGVKSLLLMRELAVRKPEYFFGQGSDLLVYHMLDRLMDDYHPVLEFYETKIDCLEEGIFNHSSKNYLETVLQVKRDIFHCRKIIAPQRDTLNHLTRNPGSLINSRNLMYFRDVYDHLFRIYGTVDGFHEWVNGILQAYFSYSSNRLNATIQRMTVFATLSMPAIMIASIYGMNFKHMPELNHPYGYFAALGTMAVISIAMLVFMKLKKWI
jgi:magnesium transporter